MKNNTAVRIIYQRQKVYFMIWQSLLQKKGGEIEKQEDAPKPKDF